MGTVDESVWERRCPRCGNTDPNVQCPVTFENALCPHCHNQVFPPRQGKDIILYYRCQQCEQRYLIPKLDDKDLLVELTKPP